MTRTHREVYRIVMSWLRWATTNVSESMLPASGVLTASMIFTPAARQRAHYTVVRFTSQAISERIAISMSLAAARDCRAFVRTRRIDLKDNPQPLSRRGEREWRPAPARQASSCGLPRPRKPPPVVGRPISEPGLCISEGEPRFRGEEFPGPRGTSKKVRVDRS